MIGVRNVWRKNRVAVQQTLDQIVFRCRKVSEGQKGKEGVGRERRNEVGQLGCACVKEVGENGG